MLGNIGWSGLILILIALLLVFGPSKLPEIGKAFGRSLREFRKATHEMTEDITSAHAGDQRPVETAAAAQTVEPIVLKEESRTEDDKLQG